MSSSSALQVPPPRDWQNFEDLCLDLFRRLWNNVLVKKHGRQGQSQNGVDIYGQVNNTINWGGVQCKGKDNYSDKKLTIEEVKREIEKANLFEPKLALFVFATTGPKDVEIEKFCRIKTDEHAKKGLFKVDVLAWEDILSQLNDDEIDKYCRTEVKSKIILDKIDEAKYTLQSDFSKLSDAMVAKIGLLPISLPVSTTLDQEYHAELDQAREMIIANNIEEALDYLTRLKDRIWHISAPKIKFRLLTNIGAVYQKRGEEKRAAELFLKAFSYEQDDEKAICNASLAYLILGDLPKAAELATDAQTKYPASDYANSLLIYTLKEEEPIQNILDRVNPLCRDSIEVNYAIARYAEKFNKYELARSYLAKCINIEQGRNLLEVKAKLAMIILKSTTTSKEFMPQFLTEKQYDDTKTASILLNEAWKEVESSSLINYRSDWLYNRAIAKRIIGDFEDALIDIEILLKRAPTNATYLYQKAILLAHNDKVKQAIEIVKNNFDRFELQDAVLLLAELLFDDNQISQAIQLIESHQQNELSDDRIRVFLINLYLMSANHEKAEIAIKNLQQSDSLVVFILNAKLSKLKGDIETGLKNLSDGKKHINEETSFKDLKDLADTYFDFRYFAEAQLLYEQLVNKRRYDSISKKLLLCYYYDGMYENVIDLCRILRYQNNTNRFVYELESVVLEEIGDLPNAEKVCDLYLQNHSEDDEMQVRRAMIAFRSQNYDLLEKLLLNIVQIENLSLQTCIQLAYLYFERNQSQRGIYILYETRRKYFNDQEAHLAYINLFLLKRKLEVNWFEKDYVEIDCAVQIKGQHSGALWYIIESRADPNIGRCEINISNPIAQKLLGKSKGEAIILNENAISKNIETIADLKSKYIFALHESMDLFDRLFPQASGLQKYHISSDDNKANHENRFKELFDTVKQQNQRKQSIEQQYLDSKLTIGLFAHLVNSNEIDLWAGIVTDPDLGIRCSIGSIEESQNAYNQLISYTNIVTDITGILTLFHIPISNKIIDHFKKLIISQSTVDLIQQVISQKRGISENGFITIGMQGDRYVKQEIAQEQVNKYIQFLEKLLSWVNQNCVIVPALSNLTKVKNLKQTLGHLLGLSSFDSLVISLQPGYLFYSEDRVLRSLAQGEFGINGIWIQPILKFLMQNGEITKNEYNKTLVILIHSNYFQISIDYSVLIESAQQANWLPVEPFSKVAMGLNWKNCDEVNAIEVAVEFFQELWNIKIRDAKFDNFLINIFEVTSRGRESKDFFDRFTARMHRRLHINSELYNRTNLVFQTWKKARLIP